MSSTIYKIKYNDIEEYSAGYRVVEKTAYLHILNTSDHCWIVTEDERYMFYCFEHENPNLLDAICKLWNRDDDCEESNRKELQEFIDKHHK